MTLRLIEKIYNEMKVVTNSTFLTFQEIEEDMSMSTFSELLKKADILYNIRHDFFKLVIVKDFYLKNKKVKILKIGQAILDKDILEEEEGKLRKIIGEKKEEYKKKEEKMDFFEKIKEDKRRKQEEKDYLKNNFLFSFEVPAKSLCTTNRNFVFDVCSYELFENTLTIYECTRSRNIDVLNEKKK